MAKCWICGEQYYRQTETDPAESCACEMGLGWPDPDEPLRQRIRAWTARILWRLLWAACAVDAWLHGQAKAATRRWERG